MTTELLDRRVLTELFGADMTVQKAVLAEFCKSAEGYLIDMELSYRAGSCDGVRAVAHKLKSSSRTIGAMALAELCQRLEAYAGAGHWQEVVDCYVEFQPAVIAVVSYIHEH